MTSQPVEANVVLTADNTQYDQAMVASAGTTSDLGKAVDSLGQKISNLTKAAGKSLIGIAAADVAVITSATAAWSSYEKQVSRLQAQSAILTRTQDQATRVMKGYETAVKGMRTEYGTATAEAAKLVETLSKVTNIRQTRQLTDLSKVFIDMSKATGESSEGLASALTNLQKVMGQQTGNVQQTRKYADMFTYLSAQTNTSAQGLIDFTSQIAPMAEQMGLNTRQIAGFATAFSRAGQEGFVAGNVFNKITGDITRSLASGSTEIAAYANLIGVTTDRFKGMEESEQLVRIFEALHAQGNRAATTLERLGLEGPRNMRAITAVINEPGGVRAALGMAATGAESGSAARGAEAAMEGLSDQFEKLREEMKLTAEAFASVLGPILEGFMQGMEKAAGIMRKVVEGPFGDFAQSVAAILAPIAGGVGLLALFAGGLLKVAAAFALFRSSAAYGVREGFRGGPGMTMGPEGDFIARGGGMLGTRGAQIAERGSWLQRMQYNAGQPVGAGVAGILGATREGWMRGREFWNPDYQRPGPRGPLSFLAGGIGRGTQMFLTPQFDQMRLDRMDPASRRVLSQQAPWSRIRDWWTGADRERFQAGAVSDYERARQGMAGGLTSFGQMFRPTTEVTPPKDQTKAYSDSVKAIRESIKATQDQTSEVGKSSVGWKRLGGATTDLIRATTMGVAGAGYMGGRALMRSPMGMPIAGVTALGVGSALGVESNMLMMGAAGATMGPWGAAAGAAAGAVMDMVSANDSAEESVKSLQTQAEEASKTGAGLGALNEVAGKTRDNISDLERDMNNAFRGMMIWKPKELFGGLKNWIEGIGWGDSDIDELEQKNKRAQALFEDTESVIRDLAKRAGVEITGTRPQQLQQLEEFMATTGNQMLADAGTDLETMVEAKTGFVGRFARSEAGVIGQLARAQGVRPETYQEMLERTRPTQEDLEARLRGTRAGRAVLESASGRTALRVEEDIEATSRTVEEAFTALRKQGLSYAQILRQTEKTQAEIGYEDEKHYELQQFIADKARQNMQLQAPMLTRVQGFQQQLDVWRAVGSVIPQTPTDRQEFLQTRTQTVQAFAEQGAYFKQMLLAQDQYELQRARAQEDYHEQRMYQEYDYQLSRTRAEEDFNRQRGRAVADFHRNERRARYDFNLARERQEEDFNHSVLIQAKQAAQSVYDIYQRIQTQRTSSAEWILTNAQDQLTQMQEQSANLRRLRRQGMSDAAIQQLGFTDPKNAQQLARWMEEATPAIIRQANQVAGRLRIRAAREIVTDPSDLGFQEQQRAFRRGRRQSAEDFETQMRRSRQDFNMGLHRQRQDFNIMMDRQADDYDTQMQRQEKQYKKTMDRAAEDMANMANEISKDLETVLVESAERLSGSAGKQARQVLKAFQDLRKDTRPEAILLMRELADVFGFEYKEPKKTTGSRPQASVDNGPGRSTQGGPTAALGAVVPGWTPGRDVQYVKVSGGEAIMRPEWTRAVGEKNVEAMNHRARYGGFAEGGVVNPDARTYMDGEPVSRISKAQLLLAERMSGMNFGVMQGSWQPYTSYSGSSHMGPGVVDTSPGSFAAQSWLRKVGFAAWARNIPGAAYAGSGAHVHSVSRLDPGARNHAQLSSFARGEDGLGGSDYGPNPPMIPNLMAKLSRFGPLQLAAGYGGVGAGVGGGISGRAAALALLKERYPDSERAAKAMDGVHPLMPGDISAIINRYARRKIGELVEAGYGPDPGVSGDVPPRPGDLTSNQQIVRRAMRKFGWAGQWNSLYNLVMRESGFNNTAQNPTSTAYGMFQFLDGTWAGTGIAKTSDPWRQAIAGMRYIKSRYTDPNGAWSFWQNNNWYRDGSVFTQPNMIGVGEAGPEAVIPLNERGGNFLADVMGSVMGGRHVVASGRGTHIYNTRIDRSTNFTGPITVQANDPAELINKLRARQRVMALSRPSLTGSAA